MPRHQRNVKIALTVLGLLIGVAAGIVIGVGYAAPSVTDIRNACAAELTVSHAGLPPGVVPGPSSAPTTPITVDTTPATPSSAPAHRQPTPAGQ